MSIFAMNYLHDISQYDQSHLDPNQKHLNLLKENTKKIRQRNRLSRKQAFDKQAREIDQGKLVEEENRIIEEAIRRGEEYERKQQQQKKEDDCQDEDDFVKIYERRLLMKRKRQQREEELMMKQGGVSSTGSSGKSNFCETRAGQQQQPFCEFKENQNSQEAKNIRQQTYLQVIQRRHDKLKKVEKRDYFTHFSYV